MDWRKADLTRCIRVLSHTGRFLSACGYRAAALGTALSGRMERQSFKLLSERFVSQEVSLMEWSPRMDLIALGMVTGEVSLYRLSWMRVWSMDARRGDTPKAFAWRPDGKALAVGWSDGAVSLHEIEDAKKYHEFKLPSPVTCMSWMETPIQKFDVGLPYKYSDKTDELIKDLPVLPAEAGTLEDGTDARWQSAVAKNMSKDHNHLDILLIGNENGFVYVCLMGLLLIGSLPVVESSPVDSARESPVLSVCLSKALSTLTAVVIKQTGESSGCNVHFTQLKGSLISSRCRELSHLSSCFSHIAAVLEYMSDAVKAMSDAWDSIVLQIDSKLSCFSATLPADHSVQDEFLALLTCGTVSLELQTFLLNELTEKGMKKLGHSIRSSYSAIMSLGVTNLMSACQLLVIRLSQLLGMARWQDRFGVLGLSEQLVESCVHQAGSFALKVEELILVIRSSMKDLDGFFRVLYRAILILQDPSQELPDVVQLSRDGVLQVADFLMQLKPKTVAGSTAMHFNLERVSQYLEDRDLSVLPETKPSCWTEFMKGKACSAVGDFVFQSHDTKSLIQMLHSVHASIEIMFKQSSLVVGRSMELVRSQPLLCVQKENMSNISRLASSFSSNSSQLFAVVEPGDQQRALVIRSSDGVMIPLHYTFQINTSPDSSRGTKTTCQKIISTMFYSADTLALLLSSSDVNQASTYSLAFLPIGTFVEKRLVDVLDLSSAEDVSGLIQQTRVLPRTGFQSVCVSGQRRVAAVLSASGRRLILFDMEAGESDSDEEDSNTEDEN